MTHADKILGLQISDGQTDRQYSTHKIEHRGDSLETYLDLADDETLGDQFSDAIQLDQETSETYTDADGIEQSYPHRVRVGSATVRDAVVAELTDAGVDHVVAEYALTDTQKYVLEREGVTNDDAVNLALEKRAGLLDRALVDDQTREPIADAIQQIQSQDADLGTALANVYEILTGETPTETVDRLSG
jgi:hypothetical protein